MLQANKAKAKPQASKRAKLAAAAATGRTRVKAALSRVWGLVRPKRLGGTPTHVNEDPTIHSNASHPPPVTTFLTIRPARQDPPEHPEVAAISAAANVNLRVALTISQRSLSISQRSLRESCSYLAVSLLSSKCTDGQHKFSLTVALYRILAMAQQQVKLVSSDSIEMMVGKCCDISTLRRC